MLTLDQARRRPTPAPAWPSYLWLLATTGKHCVAVADLLYAEAHERTRRLATATAEYTMPQPLRSLLTQLQPYGFVQMHRSFLLNPAHPWHLDKERTSLRLGAVRVPLSEHYRDALLRTLPLLPTDPSFFLKKLFLS